METIYLNRENLATWQEKARPNVMALGCFDGLHLGHCKVIETALQKAKTRNISLALMSFFPHPKTVLSCGKEQVNYLMPLGEKEERLRKLGVDTFYIVTFDEEFAALSPGQFVASYLINLGSVHAVAGFDFSYGCKGAGHMDRLKNDSRGIVDVTKVEKVEHHGEKISSTCIREKLLKGDVNELYDLLGRSYEVKCDWDGNSFELLPYYTLPASGRYAVTLKNEMKSMQTEVIVMKKQGVQSLKCVIEIPPFMEGRLSIVWHRHIPEEKVQIHDERVLSY
ncbi:adenylyltransferase/cytidyltransferase family protein [Peribacillus sp. NPDC097295]|uniref:adenylyltransferase/cytidyltransferase family protein n=1 Tax=Peribacillus sp. NPDC097295 TaxID=3364402 RepID=UPI003806F7FA